MLPRLPRQKWTVQQHKKHDIFKPLHDPPCYLVWRGTKIQTIQPHLLRIFPFSPNEAATFLRDSERLPICFPNSPQPEVPVDFIELDFFQRGTGDHILPKLTDRQSLLSFREPTAVVSKLFNPSGSHQENTTWDSQILYMPVLPSLNSPTSLVFSWVPHPHLWLVRQTPVQMTPYALVVFLAGWQP